MFQPAGEIQHDPEACVSHDIKNGCCSCKCSECTAYRFAAAGYKRKHRLRERLTKAGIDIGDMADLIWEEIEHSVRMDVFKIVEDHLSRCLKDIKLQSTVWASSVEQIGNQP